MIRQRNRLISGVTQLDGVLTWLAPTNFPYSNIMHYYKLDEASGTGVIDSVGTINGTSSNCTVNQAGKVGQSYLFTKASSSKVAAVTTSENLASAYSYSVWAKCVNNAAPGNSNSILSQSYNGLALYLTNPSGTISIIVAHGGTAKISYIFTPTTGVWYNYVVTYDGSNLILYINNVNVSATTSTSTTGTVYNTNLGCYFDGTSSFFDGNIDEFGIWNRALTITEVGYLWNSGNGITY